MRVYPNPLKIENEHLSFVFEGRDAFMDHTKPMSTHFQNIFPPKKNDKLKPMKDFIQKKEIDEKFFYRQDKYNYKELTESIKKKDTFYQWRRVYVRENKNGVCPTLTANMGTGGHNVPLIKDDNGIRKLTPRECFNLQGFPKNFKFPDDVPNSQLYKQAGNSVTVDLVEILAHIIFKVLSKQ